MIDTLKKFWEWLKEPEKYLPPIVITCTIILFYPSTISDPLKIIALREKFYTEFSLAFLLSVSGIAWRIVTIICTNTRSWYKEGKIVRIARRHLHELTPREKSILNAYIEGQTIALDLPLDDGVVTELIHYNILRRIAPAGTPNYWSTNIQPWAFDYLNNNRHLFHDTPLQQNI
jgi:hypothetical protein